MFEDVPLLAVDRLSIEATTADLARAWPEAAEGLAPVCHALTAGNPLMLRALVAEARGNVTTPAQPQALGVRPIGQRVRRALNGAPPGALRLAQAVSVLGDDTRVAEAVAFAVWTSPRRRSTRCCAPSAREDQGRLRLVHPLVRTSVYRLLSPVERAATHLRAATLHERGVTGEQVAAHLLHAGPTGHAWAARELEEAAERALELGAPDSAASLLARAIDEPAAEDAQHARRLARLGDAASHAGLPDALSHFERALAVVPARPIALQYAGALGMAGRPPGPSRCCRASKASRPRNSRPRWTPPRSSPTRRRRARSVTRWWAWSRPSRCWRGRSRTSWRSATCPRRSSRFDSAARRWISRPPARGATGSGRCCCWSASARHGRSSTVPSHREIAQELSVTLKTVEMHRSSAYRKLDISSGAQLAARLD